MAGVVLAQPAVALAVLARRRTAGRPTPRPVAVGVVESDPDFAARGLGPERVESGLVGVRRHAGHRAAQTRAVILAGTKRHWTAADLVSSSSHSSAAALAPRTTAPPMAFRRRRAVVLVAAFRAELIPVIVIPARAGAKRVPSVTGARGLYRRIVVIARVRLHERSAAQVVRVLLCAHTVLTESRAHVPTAPCIEVIVPTMPWFYNIEHTLAVRGAAFVTSERAALYRAVVVSARTAGREYRRAGPLVLVVALALVTAVRSVQLARPAGIHILVA